MNDDYSGGHTFFPGLGLGIVPKPGRLVAFGSGCDYVHGVTKITQGVRHTYAGWFTYDEKMQDPNATPDFLTAIVRRNERQPRGAPKAQFPRMEKIIRLSVTLSQEIFSVYGLIPGVVARNGRFPAF